jgi:hypothetical protein
VAQPRPGGGVPRQRQLGGAGGQLHAEAHSVTLPLRSPAWVYSHSRHTRAAHS